MKLYKILRNFSLEALEDDVNEHISQGWTPIGGMTHVAQPRQNFVAQAMLSDVDPSVGPVRLDENGSRTAQVH